MNLYEKLHFFMFYLDHQDNSKTLNNFFLGLEYSCKYTHNKMSNQENWRCFILAIRNNGLQYEDGKWNSWVVLNQLWNCNLQQHFGHYEYWTVTQKWINFLNCNFGTLRFWTTFLGLECFYGHSNSKMSNQKTKHILILLLRILDCKDKDEKWNSWILLHHL